MMKKSEWLLQHGWGFDKTCWDQWRQHLPPQVTLLTPDRGYFCKPAIIPGFSSFDNFNVVVAHSVGLHMVPEAFYSKTHLLVILSGFKSFASSNQQNLFGKMHKSLTCSHQKVLENFYQNCGSINSRNYSNANVNLLQDDLLMLQQSIFDEALIKKIPNILLIHGNKDQIVPVQRGIDFQQLLPRSQIKFIQDANHALPTTHAKMCCELIIKAVPQ